MRVCSTDLTFSSWELHIRPMWSCSSITPRMLFGASIIMAFEDTARIQYYDNNNEFRNFTREEFKKLVDTGNQWDADIKMTNLLRTDNAANATVEFTWGKEGEHGYTDYLNLIYDGKSWHITSKVAQYIKQMSKNK